MRRKILSIGAIIALGMSMSLSADMIKRYGDVGDKFIVLPAIGVTNFKNLDKKQGFLDIKIVNTKLPTYVTDVRIGSAYKDISFSNLLYYSYSKFNIGFLGASIGTGYMQHDAKKKVLLYADINKPKLKTFIETQKAPYLKLSVTSAYMLYTNTLSKGFLFNASLGYRVPLDRADMKGGYDAEAGINYGNWHLYTNYSKFNFSGVEDQKDVSVKLGYSFKF